MSGFLVLRGSLRASSLRKCWLLRGILRITTGFYPPWPLHYHSGLVCTLIKDLQHVDMSERKISNYKVDNNKRRSR